MSKQPDLSKFKHQRHIGASKFKLALWMMISAVFFRSTWFVFSGFKAILLKSFGAEVGKGLVMHPSVQIKYPWKLKIGNHCWIGSNVWIDNLDNVTIEDHVCVSQGAYLLTGNHDYKTTDFALIMKPIIIKRGAWIGAKSVVCPGVICEEMSMLTVQSVATRNLEKDYIYQGNPAVKIKKRELR